ncbi:MAG: hypothetical protein ABI723_21140 [Bacteroidia bacterium]
MKKVYNTQRAANLKLLLRILNVKRKAQEKLNTRKEITKTEFDKYAVGTEIEADPKWITIDDSEPYIRTKIVINSEDDESKL